MAVRLPPLVGFLAAGFVINALDVGVAPELDVLADLSVTLNEVAAAKLGAPLPGQCVRGVYRRTDRGHP
jgi:hypothetical protein